MKTLKSLFLLLCLCASAWAGDITPGYTPVDGQRLTAAELLQLVNQAFINPSFYTAQVAAGTNLLNTDTLLVVSSGGVFHKLTGAQVINNPTFYTSQLVSSGIPTYGLMLYYDPTNANFYQITSTNFAVSISSNIAVEKLTFARTNASSTNILVQVLPPYPNPLNPLSTNNQAEFLTWDTNGVPYSVTFSNFLVSAVPYLGTNFTNGLGLSGYNLTNLFFSWLTYPTNTTTNAWGYNTNFPITNLYFTNSVVPVNNPTSNNIPTLNGADVIPILAQSQNKTNQPTTFTLQALWEYLTNRNTLPPYNLARVSFNGNPSSQSVTGGSTINDQFLATAHGMTGVKAVSWQFSGSSGTSLPTSPQVVSNICYYAMTVDANHFVLFTNYVDAINSNHPVAISGTVAASGNTLLYLNNFTTYNADAIQLCSGTSLSTAHYAVYYRTNLSDNLYYFTGGVQPANGHLASGIECSVNTSLSVSNMFVDTFDVGNTGGIVQNRVWVLIQPQ